VLDHFGLHGVHEKQRFPGGRCLSTFSFDPLNPPALLGNELFSAQDEGLELGNSGFGE